MKLGSETCVKIIEIGWVGNIGNKVSFFQDKS